MQNKGKEFVNEVGTLNYLVDYEKRGRMSELFDDIVVTAVLGLEL